MNIVRRDGDHVIRQAGPWTPTVHRYLSYLSRAGVDWAPKPVEFTQDEERLTFLAGVVPLYPLPAWVWGERVLRDGAARLRQLHDASIGFGVDGAIWQAPAKVPAEVICHNDFAPHNLVFDQGTLIGAIDFDMCSPGPRIWDIAYFATRVVPLTASTPKDAPPMADAVARMQMILDSYGSTIPWQEVVRVAIIRLLDLAEMSVDKADELGKPELLEEATQYRADAEFLREWRGSTPV